MKGDQLHTVPRIICLCAIAFSTASCSGGKPTPGPPRRDAGLRVLTLNLMQMSPVAGRGERFEKIAQFVKARQDEGRPVDVLLLQEGCSGVWVGTSDSLNDLRQKLAHLGLHYDLRSQPCFGVPIFLQFRVGLLSNEKILYSDSRELPCHVGNWLDDCPLPGRKRAVMAGIAHPIGRVNLFTTHLASGGRAPDKEQQAKDLLQFIRDVSATHPADLTVLGSDMNTYPDTPVYKRLAGDLTDSYAAANPNAPGPTFNLPGNPHCKGYGGGPRRIDFIFFKGKDIEVASSEVVFNIGGWFVSDHCGVLTTFRRETRK